MYSSNHSLTSALDGSEWSASRPGRLSRYPCANLLGLICFLLMIICHSCEWEDDIIMDLGVVGWEGVDWMRVIRDGDGLSGSMKGGGREYEWLSDYWLLKTESFSWS